MVENDGAHHQKRFNLWHVVQAVIGGLVVASIIALAGAVVGMRDTIIRHDILMEQLSTFKSRGNRYTSKDGESERNARVSSDEELSETIEKMVENQIRYWAAMRNHISLQQHSGAGFRMNRIEERHNDLKEYAHDCCSDNKQGN